MSGNLIAMEGPHTFKDDLESTVYILLWVALMYSKCSDSQKVTGFIGFVLDGQPRNDSGTYTGKTEFLRGQSFLDSVKFPGRPRFDALLAQLATLFAVRYEPEPSVKDLDAAKKLEGQLDAIPELLEAYNELPVVKYRRRHAGLKTHDLTIEYFEKALECRGDWPSDDRAEKQYFSNKTLNSRIPKLKSRAGSTAMAVDG
jgi:hypothetical protein